MRRNQIVGLGLAAIGLATVAGCGRTEEPVAPPPEPSAPIVEAAAITATYICDSGLTVAVAYPDPQSAQVTYRDRVYALRGAPVASGARYIDTEVEWRSQTRDGVERATLSRLVAEDAPVILERCSRPAPATAPVAPQPGAAAPSASTAAAAPPCKGPQLRMSAEGGDAGAGNRVSNISIQNVGTTPCSLSGYPGVVLQDRQGRNLTAIRSEQSPGTRSSPGRTPGPVTLAPQARAAFELAWSVVPNEAQGQTSCPNVARIRVTAPGDTSAVSLDLAFTPCSSRVRVSPIRPLTTATTPAPEPTV